MYNYSLNTKKVASAHKSPSVSLSQMRKLFTHHDDKAVHRVYTALLTKYQESGKVKECHVSERDLLHGVEAQEAFKRSFRA